MKKKLYYLLPLISAFVILVTFIFNKDKFLTQYDTNYWENKYQESNWNKGWESDNPIGDAELYAFAGWKQTQGIDPSTINTEMPPLGKYFLGLSILIFNNPNWVSLFFGIVLLYLTYLISKEIFKNKWLIFLPVFLLSLDGLFRDNLITTMLDLPFAVFIASSFYFLMKARVNNRYYFAVSLSLGAASATKMYLAGFALTGVVALYLAGLFILYRYKDIFWFLLSLPLFALIYFSSYVMYFLSGNNLWDFKYLHFWIRHFARVQVVNYPPFEILRIFFLGRWKTWWQGSGIINVQFWNPLWSLGGLFAMVNIYQFVKEKNLNVTILLLWILFFLGIYSYGVPYPRYILVILPAVYISISGFLVIILNKCLKVKLF